MNKGHLIAISLLALMFQGCNDPGQYKTMRAVYKDYVKAVQKGDYELYQWTTENPLPKAEFAGSIHDRQLLELADIGEDLQKPCADRDEVKGRATGLSPWTRRNVELRFHKIGGSWKIVEDESLRK